MPPRIEIRFFRLKDAYGFCSNFARYPVDIYGQVWPTSEHAYQAQESRSQASPLKIGQGEEIRARMDWQRCGQSCGKAGG